MEGNTTVQQYHVTTYSNKNMGIPAITCNTTVMPEYPLDIPCSPGDSDASPGQKTLIQQTDDGKDVAKASASKSENDYSRVIELGEDKVAVSTYANVVRTFADHKGAKLGAVAQPLRAALTGRTTSPGIFEVLTVLGKTESLARLADQARPS